MTPYVSVIVPTYQRARLLAETVEALLGQTETEMEIIVADDGSTDETPSVVASFRDSRLRYLRSEHVGMPRIWNAAFGVARGEYVMTCHDHDIYESRLLQELAAALDRHPSAVYAHCGIIAVTSDGAAEVGRYVLDCQELTSGNVLLSDLLLPDLDCKVSALSMVRRAALQGRGMDERFEQVADVELWLRLTAKGDVAYVSRPLIRVRERDRSSELFHRSARLAERTLAAKKLYLPLVADPVRRRAIRQGWRRATDRVVLTEWWKASRHPNPGNEAFLMDFIRQEGTRMGQWLCWLLARLPRPMAAVSIRAMKRLYHRTAMA